MNQVYQYYLFILSVSIEYWLKLQVCCSFKTWIHLRSSLTDRSIQITQSHIPAQGADYWFHSICQTTESAGICQVVFSVTCLLHMWLTSKIDGVQNLNTRDELFLSPPAAAALYEPEASKTFFFLFLTKARHTWRRIARQERICPDLTCRRR